MVQKTILTAILFFLILFSSVQAPVLACNLNFIVTKLNQAIKSNDIKILYDLVSSNGVEFGTVLSPEFKNGFDDYVFKKSAVKKIVLSKAQYSHKERYGLLPIEYEFIRIFEAERPFFLQMMSHITFSEIHGSKIGGKSEQEHHIDKNQYLVISYGQLGEGGSYSFWFLKNRKGVYKWVKFR